MMMYIACFLVGAAVAAMSTDNLGGAFLLGFGGVGLALIQLAVDKV